MILITKKVRYHFFTRLRNTFLGLLLHGTTVLWKTLAPSNEGYLFNPIYLYYFPLEIVMHDNTIASRYIYTRTEILLVHEYVYYILLRGLFLSGLRFFKEPETSDSGSTAWSSTTRTCTDDFYVLKNSVVLSRLWNPELWVSKRAQCPEQNHFCPILYLFIVTFAIIWITWGVFVISPRYSSSSLFLFLTFISLRIRKSLNQHIVTFTWSCY